MHKGNPIFFFNPWSGKRSDRSGRVAAASRRPSAILADLAKHADRRVRKPLTERGIEVVIPSKKNLNQPDDYERFLSQARHLVENFFCQT